MTKNKKLILKVTTLLMAYSFIIPSSGSGFWIGEPILPSKLKYDKIMD